MQDQLLAVAAQLEAAGYRAVGKDFPVFLHPDSKEEYALARTERKRGHGYRGFEFNASSDTTLEQDLWRRDLTINAIYATPDGDLFDPVGGQVQMELLLKRPIFYHINKLHMAAASKAWVWIADALAAILIFVTLSGLFILKGRNGLTGRGLWLTLLGILLPLFFIVFYIS